ncbi:hypothetical protein SprV_0100352800 [Sparganum proliferum]
MQENWTVREAEEIQGYADRNEWKEFFAAIKAVYGPTVKAYAPLLNTDGSTLLAESVLNRPSTISDAATARLPQVETNGDLDIPPSLLEIIRAV